MRTTLDLTAVPPLAELLPHRGPALLLDRLLDFDVQAGHVSAEVALGPAAQHARNGMVPALVLVEYMAQAAAVLVGLLERDKGRPAPVGFLISVSAFEVRVKGLPLGHPIQVVAKLLLSDPQAGRFECEVQREGEWLARGHLTLVRALDSGEGK